MAFADSKLRMRGAVAPRRLSRIPTRDAHGFSTAGGHWNPEPPLVLRGVATIVEPWGKLPPHWHVPRHTLNRSGKLTHRVEPIVGKRQRIDDANSAAVRREGGLEDVGVRKIAARALERHRWLDD